MTKDPRYLNFVRSLPCVVCGCPGPSVAHHAIDIGLLPGMGAKVSDDLTMPMCRRHHDRLHRESPDGWVDAQADWICATIEQYLHHIGVE